MALDHPGDSREDPLIFVSDASAEAGRLTSALRERGFVVIDVPLTLLVGRVAVQKPALILCDVDAPGALDQVRKLRDVPGGGSIDIVFLGAIQPEASAIADEMSHEASGYFVRPVDTFQLLRKVEALVGAPSSPGRVGVPTPSSRPPPALSPAVPRASSSPDSAPAQELAPDASAAPALPSTTPPKPRAPSPVPTSSSSSLPPSRSSAPPARMSSIPAGDQSLPPPIPLGFGAEPEARGSPLARQIPQSEISPELEGILARAEQRVGSMEGSVRVPASMRMTPEAEVDAVLPADVLAALDEPLDMDEEDEAGTPGTGRGSTGGTGSGRTGLGTNVGATGGGFGPSGTSAGSLGTGVLGGTSVERAGSAAPAPAVAVGPTAPPPRRISEPIVEPPAGEPAERAAEPAPTRPPSWPPLAASSAMTSVEQRPMSLGPGELERERAAQRAPTPLPPAPTPEGIRLGPPTSRVVEPAPLAPPAPPVERAAATPEIPAVLGRGDAPLAIARAVRSRFSGALAFESDQGIRRVVLRDGDFVTAASSVASESLLAFLAERGTISPDVGKTLGHRLPPFGRHAGAALIAHGHLRQDELWPVLRSHAEWLVGHVVAMTGGGASIEREVPARLQAEPAVFGGATGAEVFVEVVRRVLPADQALSRLGGPRSRVVDGAHPILLGECALTDAEVALVNRAKSTPLGELVGAAATTDFAAVLYALVQLGVLEAVGPSAAQSIPAPSSPRIYDLLDEQALRARILARKALVDEGDYFALLGVSRSATSYDIQRAYGELRREFEPSRALTAGTADLRSDVDLILEILAEAFEILNDQIRRERYRRALEANP